LKKTHLKAESLIRAAIKICGQDYALAEVSALLNKALTSLGTVGKKRTKRNEFVERFQKEAKQKSEKWLKQIAEDAKKAAALRKVEENVREQKPPQS